MSSHSTILKKEASILIHCSVTAGSKWKQNS